MSNLPEKRRPQPSRRQLRQLLNKRVDIPAPKSLSRNVKEPRWIRAMKDYFVGSWVELREVQWPNRGASLSLTLAVVLFTLVMVAFTLAVDSGFEQLFKGVITK